MIFRCFQSCFQQWKGQSSTQLKQGRSLTYPLLCSVCSCGHPLSGNGSFLLQLSFADAKQGRCRGPKSPPTTVSISSRWHSVYRSEQYVSVYRTGQLQQADCCKGAASAHESMKPRRTVHKMGHTGLASGRHLRLHLLQKQSEVQYAQGRPGCRLDICVSLCWTAAQCDR